MTNVAMMDTPILVKLLSRFSGAFFARADQAVPRPAKGALCAAQITHPEQKANCMKDMVEDITEHEARTTPFLKTLDDQHSRIASHTLSAWDGDTLDKINGNLDAAEVILLEIADTAGANGFTGLGAAAQACADEVLAHLEGPDADLAICPGEIIYHMDLFVAQCRDILHPQG